LKDLDDALIAVSVTYKYSKYSKLNVYQQMSFTRDYLKEFLVKYAAELNGIKD